jgi:cytochrome P450
MSSRPTTDLELSDPDFVRNPYPALASLRATAPMVWHEPSGSWLATTHGAVSQVLRERALGRLWSDREPSERFEPFNTLHRNQMMENEPPVHTRLRRLVASAFARGHVERMRPRVAQLAAELLDAVDPAGFDLVADYAEPLPVAVIADMLGVPAADRPLLRRWSQAIVRMYEYDRSAQIEQQALDASAEFAAYVAELVQRCRKDPGADLVSDLVAARDAGTRLNDEELVASVVLLLNAGHEASVNTFGNGIMALLDHPDQLSRLVDADVSMDVAVEELIRYDAPLQLFERTAARGVETAGVQLDAGDTVAALMGSANRDADAFSAADTFDVSRDPNPHVGFGLGVHFCLGAPLARMELSVSLAALLTRFPHLRLTGEPVQRPTFVLRGFERIPVTC